MSCVKNGLLLKCEEKRLFYDPHNPVTESLQGISLVNSGLIYLEDCNAIVCRDCLEITDKVKIISGGACGNEPAYAGYVGRGMLTAAVFGNLKSAPTVHSIVEIITKLGVDYQPGILLIVQNRPGYILNFNIAKERASKLGIKVQMLIVHDEVTSLNCFNSRGLLGTLFVQKIAGGMSEDGKSLDEIFNFCATIVNPCISSLALCRTSSTCCYENSTKMEIGCGIHGERGTEQIEFTSYKDIITKVVHLLTKSDESENKIKKEYALMISNLGGFSELETNILAKNVIVGMNSLGSNILRSYTGHLMTSMTTAGFQISILQISHPDVLKYLDAHTQAPSWPRNVLTSNIDKFPVFKKTDYNEPSLSGPKISTDYAGAFLTILMFACEALIACADQIDIIDQETGDGDCGTSLKKGAEAIKQAIEDETIGPTLATDLALAFQKIQQIIEKNVNGLQGGVYSIFFEAISNYFGRIEVTTLHLELWSEALSEAIGAISKQTGALKGDRTMLDSLIAAYEALNESIEKNKSDLDSIGESVTAAENKAIETTSMGENISTGFRNYQKFKYPDAGAHAVGVWMRAMYEGIKLKLSCLKDNPKPQDIEFITII